MFFFFKQKTAYEMRISDWSSDVCSSDLPPHKGVGGTPMSHLTQSHSDLLARSRRIAGQVGAVERALLADKDCAEILHLVAAVRGAVNGLLNEIIVHHLEAHVSRPGLSDAERARGRDDLLAVIRRYSK